MGRDKIVGNIFREDWETIWKNAITLYRKELAQNRGRLRVLS
ncbi:MAG: hypothetical protein ABSE71_03185 [Candidatus Micrarchaeaceae archaeon]|jgi:uncharacterized protein (UPF0216 family)